MFEGEKHDGVSPIIFEEGKNAIELRAQFHQLWDYLVPPSGQAETAQGEIIRIAGRIQHEMLDNGCICTHWRKNSFCICGTKRIVKRFAAA